MLSVYMLALSTLGAVSVDKIGQWTFGKQYKRRGTLSNWHAGTASVRGMTLPETTCLVTATIAKPNFLKTFPDVPQTAGHLVVFAFSHVGYWSDQCVPSLTILCLPAHTRGPSCMTWRWPCLTWFRTNGNDMPVAKSHVGRELKIVCET